MLLYRDVQYNNVHESCSGGKVRKVVTLPKYNGRNKLLPGNLEEEPLIIS